MPTFLIKFAQTFRLPECDSLARLENVALTYEKSDYYLDNPFLKVELNSVQDAQRLVKRSILIKSIYELWGEGKDYEELHHNVKKTKEKWDQYKTVSFKFNVSAFSTSCSKEEQVDIINSFAYLGLDGPIDMKNPEVQFEVLQDNGMRPGQSNFDLKRVFMGRLIGSGSRELVQSYDLKKRGYLGTTSMDAELSLVMANQALATPGKLVYDPFVGTGSFLLTCAHFGAFTIGSDIDGRQIRGKGNANIKSNVDQYKLQGRVLDTLVFDICHHPWRTRAWLDAIVTAPYGVRAGAKKLGRAEGKGPLLMREYEGKPMHTREDYYPPTQPYEMSEVLSDLLDFSVKNLRVGGRLVYWLPTVVDKYSDDDLPQHECMTLVANSEQNFGKWARRLITMEKIKEPDLQDETTSVSSAVEQEKSQPGHFLFREQYFKFGCR